MSVLPAEVGSALARLLHDLSSADNHLRSSAEEQLGTEWVAARPEILLMGLVEQIQHSQEPAVCVSPILWPVSEDADVGCNCLRRAHSLRSSSVASHQKLERSRELKILKRFSRSLIKPKDSQSGRNYWNALKQRASPT